MLPLKHTWLQAYSKTKANYTKWNKNHEASIKAAIHVILVMLFINADCQPLVKQQNRKSCLFQ